MVELNTVWFSACHVHRGLITTMLSRPHVDVYCPKKGTSHLFMIGVFPIKNLISADLWWCEMPQASLHYMHEFSGYSLAMERRGYHRKPLAAD